MNLLWLPHSSVISTAPCVSSCLNHTLWTVSENHPLAKYRNLFFLLSLSALRSSIYLSLRLYRLREQGWKWVTTHPKRVPAVKFEQEQSPVKGLAQWRDLSLSGSANSQVRITAVVGAFGSANLSGGVGGSAAWEAQPMSASPLLLSFAFL